MADSTLSTEGGGKFADPPKKTRVKRSGFHRAQGARVMKEYPLTGPEMWQLAGVGLAATFFFAGGAFCLSSWFDVYKDLTAPPSEMTQETLGCWKAMKDAFFYGTIACFGLGLAMTGLNGLSIWNIIRNTEHPQ